MKLSFLSLLLFSMLVVYSNKIVAQRAVRPGPVGSWRLLGERVINFTSDRDFITVNGADVFRKLKFKIIDAPVLMRDMKVMFENNQTQDIPLNFRMERGHESRLIDLIGIARRIKLVYFNYRTVVPGFRGRAKILLFGQK